VATSPLSIPRSNADNLFAECTGLYIAFAKPYLFEGMYSTQSK